MKYIEAINCPVCKSSNVENILNLNCGKLDGSTLYQNVIINTCNDCGHIYNKLSAEEVKGLIKYYNEEYAPTNMAANDNVGDRPGSRNQFSTARYAHLYDLLKSFINTESRVLDVGCAMGGFLDYLNQQGFSNLFGIDVTAKYVDYVSKLGKYSIKLGNAESIPFSGKYFDCLVLDQVMEHLVEPINAFKEAKRVLREGGFFCIAVPDAGRYDQKYFFDFYWFVLREHIQHFDIEHLELLAGIEGFELVSLSRSESPMMSESMILPNLYAIFRLSNDVRKTDVKSEYFNLQITIRKYIAKDTERLNNRRVFIEQIKQSQKLIYVWGIGREFLYLYEEAGLKYCNIVDLIDNNPYKQTHVTVGGKSIVAPSILKSAESNSALLITAVAHKNVIMKALEGIEYKGQIIDL